MAGRIITYHMHPWECSTDYAALVAMRCNVIVQDLRRVLPPAMRMPGEELEPAGQKQKGERIRTEHTLSATNSVGPQNTWGWFQHLGTTEHAAHEVVIFTDWHQEFCDLLDTSPTSSGAADASDDPVCQAARAAAVATFVDAHNTSYYVKSYATKVNQTMDDFLCKLLDSVRRLKDEWSEREAQQAAADAGGSDVAPDGPVGAVAPRQR